MRRASFRQSLLQGECYSAWGSATTAASPGAMKDLLRGDGLIPAMRALVAGVTQIGVAKVPLQTPTTQKPASAARS